MRWKEIHSSRKETMCEIRKLGTTGVLFVNIYGIFYVMLVLISTAFVVLLMENMSCLKKSFF